VRRGAPAQQQRPQLPGRRYGSAVRRVLVEDLDDDYDRAAAYKIVLDEGTTKNLRELVNGRLLQMIWPQIHPARPVRALWERMFPQLRATA
jgi:hypothetical protein